ncbi:RagB/SusD family nutrient uptake outer membrane protein [Mangrovibacterium sp.]|uniref:RagB/SusD family nutrient uptake outer membrane protein n=1 Tax=Mangrovibacterium sp. TaxID=1961364 RepID=UPI003569A9FB
MRKLYRFIILCITLYSVGACDYLNIVPDNVATIDYAFRNRTVAEKYLFTCYSYRPTIGGVNLDPALGGADETWLYYPANWPNTWIARGYQNATSPYINYWDGENSGKPLWEGIRDCNIFLENIGQVQDMDDFEKDRWIAEVKFLKAYYHYYLFKCYGPIPIVDVNLPISAGVEEVKVYRESVDDVVTYITDLMAEAMENLPKSADVLVGIEAGRADKTIASAMRAEVLMLAASPLFNGNTDYASIVDNRGVQLFPQSYDENKWVLAAEACKEAIDLAHEGNKAIYDLVDPIIANAPDQFKLQTTYRQAICDRWNKELIWGNTNNDASWLQVQSQAKIVRLNAEAEKVVRNSWAPTIKLVEKYYSTNGVPIEEDIDWQDNGWYTNRYKVRTEPSAGEEIYYVKEGEKTAYLHFEREPRFYASIGFDRGIYFGSGYYDFPGNVKFANFFALGESGKYSSDNYSLTGYTAKKMHSFKNTLTSSAYTTEYYPFPIMRLADLYLLYAEALNEVGGPTEEVFTYIDAVRERAGLAGVKESWLNYSVYPNKPETKEGLREIIHRERTIELALEGKRFWDIRRWKKIDELNEQPKGWNIQGQNTEDFYKVLSVAQSPVKFTVKDYLWPIKEENITVNNNLVQNYGW